MPRTGNRVRKALRLSASARSSHVLYRSEESKVLTLILVSTCEIPQIPINESSANFRFGDVNEVLVKPCQLVVRNCSFHYLTTYPLYSEVQITDADNITVQETILAPSHLATFLLIYQ
jgi:hypothetical protein